MVFRRAKRSKDCWAGTGSEARVRQGLSLRVLRGSAALLTRSVELLASRAGRGYISVILSQLVCYGSLEKLMYPIRLVIHPAQTNMSYI